MQRREKATSSGETSFYFHPEEGATVHVFAGPALAAEGHRVTDRQGATFDVPHLGGPVSTTHLLDFFGPVGWILTQTQTSVQRSPSKPDLCSSLHPPRPHLLEAHSFAHGGADPLGASAALHLQADGGQMTAQVEALRRPRERQKRYHDDQLHPLPVAVSATCH